MIHQARGFYQKHPLVVHQSIPEPVRQSIRRRNQTVMNHRFIIVCGALIALNQPCGLRAAYLVASLVSIRMNEA
jgi:hypothetical protein